MQYHIMEHSDKLAQQIEAVLESDEQSRYYKRLYTVMLVARHPQNNCSDVARQLGYSEHTVARWVRSICENDAFDLSGVKDGQKPGRHKRLTDDQLSIIKDVLKKDPQDNNHKKWTGKLLSNFVLEQFNVVLQERQCQKIIKNITQKGNNAIPV